MSLLCEYASVVPKKSTQRPRNGRMKICNCANREIQLSKNSLDHEWTRNCTRMSDASLLFPRKRMHIYTFIHTHLQTNESSFTYTLTQSSENTAVRGLRSFLAARSRAASSSHTSFSPRLRHHHRKTRECVALDLTQLHARVLSARFL